MQKNSNIPELQNQKQERINANDRREKEYLKKEIDKIIKKTEEQNKALEKIMRKTR